MKSFISGQDLSFEVLFEQGLDTVVPDLLSVSYQLYGNSGTAIGSAVPVTTTTEDTSITVPVLAANNAIGSGLDFENRTIIVTWEKDSNVFQTTVNYRIIPMVPLAVNGDSCRALIGVARNELPDSDLDIFGAYIETRDHLGSALVTAALTAGNKTTLSINRAIAVRALLNILGSLELRVMQKDKSNTAMLSRFAKIDFAALRVWLAKLYDEAGTVITGDSTGFYSGVVIGTTTRTTDPVTGAAPEA